jgi:hypothetical protein
MTPPRGDPLKSNSISMYFPFREKKKKKDFASSSHGPAREICAAPLPPSPHLFSQAGMCTHKSGRVVVADGLGIAKCCRDEERGGEVAEGRMRL